MNEDCNLSTICEYFIALLLFEPGSLENHWGNSYMGQSSGH